MTRLIFFGDNDTTSDAKDVNAAMVKETNVDAYCFVGDGPYAKSGTKWVEQQKVHFDDKKDKMIWSRGNHDEDESESKQTQKDMEAWFPEAKALGISDTWLMSKQVGNAYVISMDTQDLRVEFDDEQFTWVKAELLKAKQLRTSGQIDWIIVLFHKPFFTLKSSHSPYTAVRFMYKDAFRDAQVDFCVSGHNHNTQLWLPMIPNQSQANGEGEQLFTKLPDGTFDFSKDHGACFIVSGHAGHEWNGINDQENSNVMHYRDSGKFGYTLIETNGKQAHVMSKDIDNATTFEYKVTREGNGTTPPPPPPPPEPCPPGQHKDPVTGECIPDDTTTPPEPTCTCPAGYIFDKPTHSCIKNTDPDPTECKEGWYFNEELKRCIPKLEPPVDSTAPKPVDARFASPQLKAKVGSIVVLDGSGSLGFIDSWNIEQESTDVTKVTLTDVVGKKYSKQFTMPDTKDEVLDFKLSVSNIETGSFDSDSVMVQKEDDVVVIPPTGTVDAFGMQILGGKPTGKNVAMEKGSNHRNGQRYNVNHEFHSYIQQGYYRLGKGQAAINHKGDGPNHGGCKDADVCLWYEFHVELSDGQGSLQYENPHPDNHDVSDDKLESVKAVGKLNAGDWIGWATAYYWGPDGKRHMKAFVDKTPFGADGKPLNNWEEVCFAIEKGQIVTSISHPRDMQKVIDHEAGFESEIRMHGATSGDTEMKNAWVIELEPQGTPS